MATERRLLKTALDYLATLAVIATCSVFLWRNLRPAEVPAQAKAARPATPLPTEPISLDGLAVRGNPTAKVAIIEFSDFECPFCGKFVTDVMPDLGRDYIEPGRVKFAFQHLPLDIHPNAFRAAQAANCAGAQGRFWEMHDAMFLQPKKLDEAGLLSASGALGLNIAAFTKCLSSPEQSARVRASEQIARTLKIQSAPTFLLGRVGADGRVVVTQLLTGAKPVGEFKRVIDSLLADPR